MSNDRDMKPADVPPLEIHAGDVLWYEPTAAVIEALRARGLVLEVSPHAPEQRIVKARPPWS